VAELPRNGELLALFREHGTIQAVADAIGAKRETLRDHIYRIGMREAIEIQRDGAQLVARPQELDVIVRDYSEQETHLVYPLGDVHKGAKMHDRKLWREWLRFIERRPEASLLGTGDFLNTAIVGSKSDVYDETMTVGDAKRELRTELATLADAGRIDALIPGNHENRITRATGDCPIRDVCDVLDVNYVEAAALFVYKVGGQEYEVYFRHGTGSGQSLAGLKKSAMVVRADVYVTGHTHQQAMTADDWFVRVTDRGGSRAARRKRYFVSSGSFLGYEKYAAERGYPPSRKGAPRIYLDGRRWDVHVSL